MGFMDMENAYDTVPRGIMTAMVIWMGAPETEAGLVEAMYERTKGRVAAGSGTLDECPVNIGLRQGSALCVLVFIMVMELLGWNAA